MRLLAPDHAAALRDTATWFDNPFASRDARRDARRSQLTRTICWFSLMLAIVCIPAFIGLQKLVTITRGVPWYLTGDPVLALLVLVSGIHVWFISSTAQRGTVLILGQEASRNTLMHLLTLPTPTFQVVLQIIVYPWCAAMRVALLMLPVYAMGVAMDRISLLDLVMLYAVFSSSALALPLLRRPALGDMAPVVASLPQRQQAASAAMLSPNSKFQSGAGNTNSAGGWMAIAFIIPMLSIVIGLASGRGPGGANALLHPYLPSRIIALLPSSMVSWPLLLGRLLITPLSWFSLRVPLIVFALPLALAQKYFNLVRTAEFMQVGSYRDLASLPTYLARRRGEAAIRSVWALVIVGYLWKWIITRGGLQIVLPGTNPSAPGLEGFAYTLYFLCALTTIVRASSLSMWMRLDFLPRKRLATRKITWLRAARYLLMPTATFAGFYLLCCTLSLVNPYTPAITANVRALALLTVSGSLLSFGAGSVLGNYAAIPSLLIPATALVGFNSYQLPWAKTLGFLSPSLGLIAVLHPNFPGLSTFYSGMHWQQWLAPGLLIGLSATSCGLMRLSRMASKNKSGQQEGTIPLDPTAVGPEAFMDETSMAMDPTQKEDTALALGLVGFMSKYFDNPVAVREVRARLRGKFDTEAIRNLLVLLLVGTVLIYQAAPELATTFGHGLSQALYGNISNSFASLISDIQCCFLIVLGFIIFAGGFVTLNTFTVERDKSTLGFLLLTPMRASSILNGKALGILTASGVISFGLIMYTALLALIITPYAGTAAITGWGLFVASCVAFYVCAGISVLGLGAVLSRFTISPGCWSFGGVVLFQVGVNGGRFLFKFAIDWISDLGITAYTVVQYAVAGILLTTVGCYLIGILAIKRMRASDLKFASAKKEN